MSSLFGTLSIALSGLRASQGELDVTSNNVANANTPGYSRQRAVLVQADPIIIGPLTFGSGVSLLKVESLRDSVLEVQIQQENQGQGQIDAFLTGMRQVEVMFTSSQSDIGAQFSKFFASLSELSTNPSDLSLRQGVLTAAGNLASTFNNIVTNLTLQRQNLDLSIVQDVQQVNALTTQIAGLNGQIQAAEDLGREASSFIDKRDVLIEKLSSLIDVSSIRSDNGIALTTSNGTPLVDGMRSYSLNTQVDASGVQHIYAENSDITSKLSSGAIAGVLMIRDQKIPDLLSDLDTLAAGFEEAVNAAQKAGYDLNGQPAGNLFTAPPAGGTGAAGAMSLFTNDPAAIAASSDGSAGSNGNVAGLLAVHDQLIAGGRTPSDFYSKMVFTVGNDVANAEAEAEASQLVLQQLQDQRGSISGVSLDEEAANLIQFQRAYEASARVISTINDVLDVTINLGRY
ncbi:MAG TPA: flagellar hook-associated protein FlgK [Terriglobales bacterium]|nr:flagellar hook-associated protein FlgK [Terriglobales bacterium]